MFQLVLFPFPFHDLECWSWFTAEDEEHEPFPEGWKQLFLASMAVRVLIERDLFSMSLSGPRSWLLNSVRRTGVSLALITVRIISYSEGKPFSNTAIMSSSGIWTPRLFNWSLIACLTNDQNKFLYRIRPLMNSLKISFQLHDIRARYRSYLCCSLDQACIELLQPTT